MLLINPYLPTLDVQIRKCHPADNFLEYGKGTWHRSPNPFLQNRLKLDGYWRMVVNQADTCNFVYLLPSLNTGDDIELVIPDALQVGWRKSLPLFWVATETTQDIAESNFSSTSPQQVHPMKNIVLFINWADIPKVDQDLNETFLHLLEVYFDDFIALIQTTNVDHAKKLTKSLLNAISDIFPLPPITGSKMGPPIHRKRKRWRNR